jgi:glycosyltransferase involved in cell wall biosynthesis
MRVSIVTPAFNAAATLGETARSVLAQTFADWEWLIVDDGSTDATRDVVIALGDPRIRLITIEHSGLPAVARNRGVAEARGELVAFLDADDVWLPEKLAAQLACFATHPEASLVFTKVRYRYEELGRVGRTAWPSTRGVANPGFLFDDLVLHNLIATSSVLVRRSLLEPFDEDPRQRGTEDYELWLRLAPRAPFAFVDEPLVVYRVHAQSLSGRAVPILEGRLLALSKHQPALHGQRFEAQKLLWLGYAQLHDGVEHCGRAALLRSLRIHPTRAALVWLAVSLLGPRLSRWLRRIAYRLA